MLKGKMMYRKHIWFGFLLLLITLVHQIPAEEEAQTPNNPSGETESKPSDEAINEMDHDYLAKEEEMFEKYFYLFNS